MGKSNFIVGRIETGLVKAIPVYKHSGVCVVNKTSVTTMSAASFNFCGELPCHRQILKDSGLILHRDFFTANKTLAIQITGSKQTCKDTLFFTLNGLRKLVVNPLMSELGAERTKNVIKQIEDLEKKLFKKDVSTIKVNISKESVSKPVPKVVKLKEAVNGDVIDAIVDRVIDRIADQAIERLLLRA